MAGLKIGITCYPSLGGSGVIATELGKLLAEKGHEIHFITHNMPFRLGAFHKNIVYHEVEVNDYSVFRHPPYDLSLASKQAQVAKLQNLDLLHVHYAVPHAICALLAKQMVGDRLKVVTTLHGTDITVLGQDESLSDLIRFGINKSDAVTAVSNDLIRETVQLLHIEKPIDLVYNFVDKRVYYPRECKWLRREFAGPREKIIMHISNFRPVKRLGDVIAIFRRVNEAIPSKLLLVGEGPDLPKVHCKVKELGIADRVIFLGKQDEVAQLVSLADLMLLPSEKESFGLVALEAMACGVPTVASTAGGIPELITHGETGYLAPVGDTETMALLAARLLTDPVLYKSFSQACIERACRKFNSDQIVEQYEHIYYRVLGKTMPTPECIGESAT
ncbi:MAG TPA: N-acetyl-alpha-D-glucosaminyl L-malate synthase BshA [Bacilli bacterium]